jgi:hypothetical protein
MEGREEGGEEGKKKKRKENIVLIIVTPCLPSSMLFLYSLLDNLNWCGTCLFIGHNSTCLKWQFVQYPAFILGPSTMLII